MRIEDYDGPTLQRLSASDDEVTAAFWRVPSAASGRRSEPPPASGVRATPLGLHVARAPGRRSSSPPPPTRPRAWAELRSLRSTPARPRPLDAVQGEVDVELDDVTLSEATAAPRPVSPGPQRPPLRPTILPQAEDDPPRRMTRVVVVYGCAVAMVLLWLLIAIATPDATAAAARLDGTEHATATRPGLASSIGACMTRVGDWTAQRRASSDAAAASSRPSGDEATGTLIVESHAGPCALHIDGRSEGDKRRVVKSMPAGAHVVSCARSGSAQTRRTVVRSGEITYLGFANGGMRQSSAPLDEIRF